jgi:transposase
MNLPFRHVLTDLTGQSGLAILEAILAGERNPRTLAGLVDRRVKQSREQIEAALTGDYRAEALFVVCTSPSTTDTRF